jgi:uroporphyrinogen-III synthase
MGLGLPSAQGFQGLRVLAFESRLAAEIGELIRRRGGEPIVAPSMQEVPLSQNVAAFDLLRRLEGGALDVVVLMTGVGLRTLVAAVASEFSRERAAAALGRATLVARGPKPVAALRELGRQPDLTAPEPNTWREILATCDAKLSLAGKRVAVQEYGAPKPELIAGLEARGAAVLSVPVYRWTLPADTEPLRAAVGALRDGTVDIALFTSGIQVHHLFQVAGDEGGAERLRAAFARVLIASIGPVCSEALQEHGLAADLEPQHAKMGQLVVEVARRGPALLKAKRGL